MLAHELRNPLAPIVSAARMLAAVADDAGKVRHLGQIVTRQAEHMSNLVTDLLDVSRVTSGLVKLVRERVDIRQVVDESIEQVMPFMDAKRHKLTLSSSMKSALVMGDRKRLVQVVTNLMQNAAKYTPDGGEISVAIDANAERLDISIRDNGIGMDAELLPFVFDLFTQERRSSDRAQGGLGLGLALVKSLVTLHDGQVQARSDGRERGSTFTVSLPLIEALPHEIAAEMHSPSAVPKQLKMLVVDDNVDAADLLAMFLETSGHKVVVQYSSADALETAAVEKYDVFLLDIGLPDMDGNELARRLRMSSQSAHATLIAVTGYGQEYDKESSIAAGFDYYFVKPANPNLLVNLLAGINPA
jgi:CheY-like chemotaxis protein/two-component sensor histidine kinase